MTEPTAASITLTTVAGVGLTALFPSIDGNALIGAFAGSSLVAISSKNCRLTVRFAYMLISLSAGYLAAPEVIALTPLNQSGVAAFVASAAVIALTLHIIELIKTIQLPKLAKHLQVDAVLNKRMPPTPPTPNQTTQNKEQDND